MILRVLNVADLPAVAALHVGAFPRAAVSRLGCGAAARYYESLMCGPHGTVGLGAYASSRLTGFCFVGVRHIAEPYFVRRHAAFLAWRLLSHPWLLAEPFIRDRILTGLRLLRRPTKPAAAPRSAARDEGRSFGIQYLAVDPEWQGQGVGRRLLGASEDLAREQGCTEIHLSVYLDNARAIRLYERQGWQRSAPDGVWEGLMCKRLNPEKLPAHSLAVAM